MDAETIQIPYTLGTMGAHWHIRNAPVLEGHC